MAIPDLNANGFLPPGVHDASLDEIRQRFGRFQETDQRVALQQALEAFLEEARGAGLVVALIVDGSFATGKARPSDIDLIVVLRENHDYGAALRPDQYNVLSKRRVRSRYPFDIFVATGSGEAFDEAVDFFQQVRDSTKRKGMVRVTL